MVAMQAIETHWLTRDRAWDEEMSAPEPSDEMPKWDELDWERGDLIDFDSEERESYYEMTAELYGVKYEGTGVYSCGELIIVDGIEIKK